MTVRAGKKERRIAVGLALSICGVSIGGLVKVAIGINVSWISILIILISLCALINWHGIENFNRVSKNTFFIYVYTVYTLLLAFMSNTGMMDGTVGLVYQLAYFLQIILLWGIDNDFNLSLFIKYAFWIFGFSTIFAFLVINIHGFSEGIGALLARTDDASAVSRATTGFIAFCGFISALVYQPNSQTGKVARITFVVMSIIVEVISSRRSVLIVLLFVILLHFFTGPKINRINRKRFFTALGALVILTVALIIIYRSNADIRNSVNRTFTQLVNGVNTYLGRSNSDMAASYRRRRIDTIPDEFFNQSSFVQIVFGRGYNTDWLDIPFMQAFWDLGLLGGIFFMFIQGIIPLRYALMRIDEPAIKFAQYYTLLRIVQNFSNGTPYGNFFPIVMLYTFMRIYESQTTESE